MTHIHFTCTAELIWLSFWRLMTSSDGISSDSSLMLFLGFFGLHYDFFPNMTSFPMMMVFVIKWCFLCKSIHIIWFLNHFVKAFRTDLILKLFFCFLLFIKGQNWLKKKYDQILKLIHQSRTLVERIPKIKFYIEIHNESIT